MSGPRRHAPQAPVPDLELLVIDGDNLLHRVRGLRDDAGVHWLVPRLRAWRPPTVQVVLMLDGAPDPTVGPRQQVAPGIAMRHSGRLDGDTAIVELVRARPYADRARTVVVTDDRQLGDRVRHVGVMVRRLEWLIEELGRPTTRAQPTPTPQRAPVGIGAGRPPRAPDATTPIVRDPVEAESEPWKPGRGATAKKGNARKAPKSERQAPKSER